MIILFHMASGICFAIRQVRTRLFILPFLTTALMLAVLPRAAVAETPQPPPVITPSDDAVNAIARQLYCPVCENTPLDVCPTQVCAQWRELIRQKLAEGWTGQQIRDYFVDQYGDRVLAEPPRHGLNWLLYTLPPLFLVIGILILSRSLRRMQHTTTAGPGVSPAAAPGDPYIPEMEEELRRREHE